jgi:hypothetical protein
LVRVLIINVGGLPSNLNFSFLGSIFQYCCWVSTSYQLSCETMHMTAPKFTRRRQWLFMTGTYGLRHLSRTKKYGFSTPDSGSSLVSSSPDGTALS